VALEDNNGDAISCIVLMVDSLARDNHSQVTIETIHAEDCHIHDAMEERSITNDTINEHGAISEEARQHLYSCNCDTSIETTFEKGDGETLLVTFPLSDAKRKHPWLDDQDQTKEFLELTVDTGSHPLLDAMKPIFSKRVGDTSAQETPHFGKQSDTLH